ncbi:hypothetical protein [Nocardioides insulae]|uniref:hypothetical protein n=1 Tax=Nocardioides insulae TaxID=394734 RepID=UPI00040F7B5D|nr:hypothetical protein [Nocardioides insulae]
MRFWAQDGSLCWACARDCGHQGSKGYDRSEDAARYATAFNRRDTEALGRRAPLIGLLPLRVARWLKPTPSPTGSGSTATGSSRGRS